MRVSTFPTSSFGSIPVDWRGSPGGRRRGRVSFCVCVRVSAKAAAVLVLVAEEEEEAEEDESAIVEEESLALSTVCTTTTGDEKGEVFVSFTAVTQPSASIVGAIG
ncbi:hypothetical protein EW145_g8249 [Phellinidium pouzarii]|uniref:Uncharacterized protein n=1 Tax=Phellinidium pouzarii TaxID=167371 RepID=A0A4S4K7W8_9AGAM|nr:hypothetical protein EW145_g8249 [Phellinidium pouzarii]